MRRAMLLALLGAALFLPQSAIATTVLAFDAEQLLSKAEHVFHGVCTDVFVRHDDKGRIVTDYSFMVTETLKGEHRVQVVFTLPGGSKHQRTTIIPGLSQHQLGDEVILFLGAGDPKSPFQYPVGLDQGVYRVYRDAQGDKRVRRSLQGLKLVRGTTPVTTLPEQVALSTFKSVVKERVRDLRQRGANDGANDEKAQGGRPQKPQSETPPGSPPNGAPSDTPDTPAPDTDTPDTPADTPAAPRDTKKPR